MIQETSKDAFKKVQDGEGYLSARNAIYQALAESKDGLTDSEISELTGLDKNIICARRNELIVLGQVSGSGVRKCSISGRNCFVWTVGSRPKVAIYKQTKLDLHELKDIIACLERSADHRAPDMVNKLKARLP
jgi:hypothetical protein